ncbi:MAG: translation initiation factor IF-2 [Puniceicoccaceae bacterium]|nr:translation initiation factor IF-2 [Puniceicoccaceae bacterium]RCL31925.1 MAG: translation initiation factor IF-2 [Puniceicoccaceae bacterium]
MSVRIHQLSKQIGMENNDLIDLLRSRGFEVKSSSSTIDNISAESLVEEFASKNSEQSSEQSSKESSKINTEVASNTDSKSESKSEPVKVVLPEGAIVKSSEEINKEREAKQKNSTNTNATGRVVQPKMPTSVKPLSRPSQPILPKSNKLRSDRPNLESAGHKQNEGSDSNADPNSDSNAEPKQGSSDTSSTGNTVIHAKPPIVVRDFALQLELKPFKLISELMEMGIFASMNQTIEESVAVDLAQRHGFTLEVHHRGEGAVEKPEVVEKPKLDEDDPKFLKPRPPVCCILGHVDHGKTTLLDAIRKTNVVGSEAGGITQHIGAYQIQHKDNPITFVDTPGHAAFSHMRARGTNVTDIAILVIAADDGFKPQTDEALKLAKAANNAIIVAINKIDAKGANVDKVKQEMQEKGIAPEDWGGETVTVEISALNGTNIDELLEMILLQAEILELQANPSANPAGTVIEAQIEQGRGAVASVIVEKGTLKKGDALISGESYCRVKSMMDAQGAILNAAGPSTAVKILGWSEVPRSGDHFQKEKNEKTAKRTAEASKSERKVLQAKQGTEEKSGGAAASVADLFAAIENQQKKCLRLIVKSDVHGSLEALINGLESIKSDKVDLEIIAQSVGNISKSDISLASAGGASIVGFNVRLDNGVQSLAKHESIQLIQNTIIYELLDEVEEVMIEMLDAEIIEKKSGAAEVRQVFAISKGRYVAGSMVTEGTIHRSGNARLMRKGTLVFEGPIETLRRFKDDVKEVRAGYECGINIKGCNEYEEGDILECYQIEKKKPSLR